MVELASGLMRGAAFWAFNPTCFAAGTCVVVGIDEDGNYLLKPIENALEGDQVGCGLFGVAVLCARDLILENKQTPRCI